MELLRRLSALPKLQTLRVLIVSVIAVSWIGCGGEPETLSTEAQAVPERIIAVAPSLVEIVFGLGLGEKVVGVGDYAQWPPEALSKPRVGGLFDVRLEKIVELDPDLAILLPGEEKLAMQMGELGVEVLTINHESIADVEQAMRTIAWRMGVTGAGDQMAEEFAAALAPDPLPAAPAVVLTITREVDRLGEVLVAGPGTFYDELLNRLGVVNAFGGSELRYPQVSAEGIVRVSPQAIIELQPKALPNVFEKRLLADWRTLPGLPAVDQGCLRVIAGDHVLLPGPRITRLYGELREALLSCSAFSR